MRVAGRRSGALTPLEEDGALDLEEQQRVAGEEGDDEHEQRDGKAEDERHVLAMHARVGRLRWRSGRGRGVRSRGAGVAPKGPLQTPRPLQGRTSIEGK